MNQDKILIDLSKKSNKDIKKFMKLLLDLNKYFSKKGLKIEVKNSSEFSSR